MQALQLKLARRLQTRWAKAERTVLDAPDHEIPQASCANTQEVLKYV